MTPSPPAVRLGAGEQICARCLRWNHFHGTFGDCRLGPPPERMWFEGVRHSYAGDTCDAWASLTDFGNRGERRVYWSVGR